jgi:hypothetical protein
MKPLFASALSDGVNMHRIQLPASLIEGSRILQLGFQELPQDATHVVFNSVFTYTDGAQSKMFAACRDAGLKVILDVDDHWHVAPTHKSYSSNLKSNYAKEVLQCIKAADMVWAASKPLFEECKKLNKKTHYISNAHPLTIQEPRSQGKRFGYVAFAQDHMQDVKQLYRAFSLLRENKLPNAQIGWLGNAGTEQCRLMQAEFERAGAYFMGQYLKGPAYWYHYRTFDVALAPLEPTQWTQYKSALKGIEAGAMGCAFICSDAEPYQDFTHGTDCLKANNGYDWFRHIKRLNQEPDYALDLSHNLQEIVKQKFDPQQWAAERTQLMESL